MAIAILYVTFENVDPRSLLELIGKSRGAIVLAALPFIAAMAVDTFGWRGIFKNLGRDLPFSALLSIRLSAEALLMSLPGGAFVAESSKPVLLKSRFDVPLTEGVASIAAGKCLVAFTHGLYLGIAMIAGWDAIQRSSRHVIGIGGLEWAMLASTLALIGVGLTMGLGLVLGSVGERSHRLLAKIPSERFRRWILQRAHRFQETDRHFVDSLRPASVLVPALCFLTAWVIEAVETFVILRLLGVDLDFAEVMAFETLLSLVRSLVFVVPAGLGVQDLGYVAFLKAYGVEDAVTVGAAFVLVKRSKELLWIVVGYLLLLAGRSRPKEAIAAQAL